MMVLSKKKKKRVKGIHVQGTRTARSSRFKAKIKKNRVKQTKADIYSSNTQSAEVYKAETTAEWQKWVCLSPTKMYSCLQGCYVISCRIS